MHRCNQHNRKEGYTVVGCKPTKGSEGFWDLEMVVGPFINGAGDFKAAWRRSSRKLPNRIVVGIQKAISLQACCVYITNPAYIVKVLKQIGFNVQKHPKQNLKTRPSTPMLSLVESQTIGDLETNPCAAPLPS